jgi:hypothetical protein
MAVLLPLPRLLLLPLQQRLLLKFAAARTCQLLMLGRCCQMR